jgi:hypothetical protein
MWCEAAAAGSFGPGGRSELQPSIATRQRPSLPRRKIDAFASVGDYRTRFFVSVG